MNREHALQYITNAMSLRTPQTSSLVYFADYLESEAGKKVLERMTSRTGSSVSNIQNLTMEFSSTVLELSKFRSFERTFPAYTFALATGVGKTRLMGAFVSYLYLVYGVQHFMIVAPGNTIYRKLVDDFSKSNNPKYVFRGIEELTTSNVKVITKDNYSQNQTSELFSNKIEINIFNIQQFAQKDIEKEKGITKGSELFGMEDGKLLSYFDYLKEQKDLVILMDESHHYHADAAMQSLDRIDPMLGLEFTATPYLTPASTRKDAPLVLKQNIFYAYNLGNAIRDGYVKDPWIGTEADVDFSQWDAEAIETDARKLQLAAYFHERSKVALKEYALETNRAEVKPVMLVVAKDTAHASALRQLIDSNDFRGGAYIGKVIEVHTKTKGDEADDTIEKLLSLEHPDNIVEVVIHVNMLKEGWDVANIYTIAPIRSSAAQILTEQTIGRGLRLPYGERTGNKNVDRVMIVAHDNYAKVIEEAQHSKLIQPTNIESVSTDDTKVVKEVIEVQSAFVANIQKQITESAIIMADIEAEAMKAVGAVISSDTPDDVRATTIASKVHEIVEQTAKSEANKLSFAEYHKHNEASTAPTLFTEGSLFSILSESARKELVAITKISGQTIELRNIPIPRLVLTPHFAELEIADFDIDTKVLSRYATDTSILEQSLQGQEKTDLFGNTHAGQRETEVTKVSSLGGGRIQSPENTILSALVEEPLIDYDDVNQAQLLRKLAEQVTQFYKTFISYENSLHMMVENNFRQIAKEIYSQILTHKEYKSEGYLKSSIKEAKPYLDQYNISIVHGEKPVTLDSQFDRFPREKVYTSFAKACHSMYRFDSSDEARLAYLLDKDDVVEDWLRPAPNQFEGLFWRDAEGNSNHRYEPDFVVEMEKEIVMIEVKPSGGVSAVDVQEKKKVADKYCELVTENIGKFGITKAWRYLIVETESITATSTISGLLGNL